MSTFIYIFLNIVLPIFILASIGFVAQRKLNMDVRTFSRINIYIFIPIVLFLKIYQAEVSLQFVGEVFIYTTVISILLFVTGEITARLLKYPRGKRKAFDNSLVFFNSGNYGFPLVELAFSGNPVAMATQIFIMLFQNIGSVTFGVLLASSGNSTNKEAFKKILQMPSLYAFALAALVRLSGLTLPSQIIIPMQYVYNGFVAVAVLTLGIQLADIKVRFNFRDSLVASFFRLIISPVLGFIIVLAMGVEGDIAKSMIIGVATPTAVNTAILAKEFDNEPDYTAQVVFISTLASSITVSLVLYVLNSY